MHVSWEVTTRNVQSAFVGGLNYLDVPSMTIHGKMKIYFNFDSVLLFLYVLGDVLLATYRKHFALKTALAERCNCLHNILKSDMLH